MTTQFDKGTTFSERDLLDAATEGKIMDICVAVAKGATVEARDSFGRYALHLATSPGFGVASWPDAVALLLDLGADVDARDAQGNTALHLAAKGNDKKIMALLLARGANPDLLNDDQMTPVQAGHFARGERPKTIDLFFSNGFAA